MVDFDKSGRKGQNINLSANDLERLLNGSRAVVRGFGGDPSGIGAPPPPGTGAGSFKPFNTIQDFVSGIRNPAIPGVSSPAALQQQAARTGPQIPTGSNSINAILGQLQKLMSGQGINMPQFQPMQMPVFDPNRYKKEAEQSVNAQYNPIINQLIAQQGQTQKRAAANRTALGDLYAGAVNDINAASKVGQGQYDAAQAQSKQMYEDERNRIAAGYAADAAAQRAEAKRLGTEALGVNDAISKQTADKQFADQMQSQQELAANSAFEQQQQGAAQYDRAIANATRQDGLDSQADVMRQLEDYMSQSNSDIANTRSQAAGQISQLANQLANQGYERDAQNQQFQYQQQRDYMGDQQNLLKLQQDSLLAQLQAAATSSQGSGEQLNPWQQVAQFSEQIDPGQGSEIVAAIQKAMNERGEIYARSKDDTPMNPALFAKLIADYPDNANLDRNALMQASQILYKLLYGNG